MTSELIKGVQWVSAMDENTCLDCLLLDGKSVDKKPPLHSKCRCTIIPIVSTWKELGINLMEAPQGTRASENGQIPADGGLFKRYLIERARSKAENQYNPDNLLLILERLKNEYPNEKAVYYKIKSRLIIESNQQQNKETLKDILDNIEWPSSYFEQFLFHCYKNNMKEEVDDKLESTCSIIKKHSPTYYAEHTSSMYNKISYLLKQISIQDAIIYIYKAYDINKTVSNGMELYKCYKRINEKDKAISLINELAIKYPNSSAIKKEKDKIASDTK